MDTAFIIGAIFFCAAAFLCWRVFQAFRTGSTAFPVLEIQSRRVSRTSDAGSFWFAMAAYVALAGGLFMFALRYI